jgi:hypothetical protein
MPRVRTRFQSQTKDNTGQMQLPLIQRKSNATALSVFREGGSLFNETTASLSLEHPVLDTSVSDSR